MGRTIRASVLLLLAGAAITVAVSWACAAWIRIGPRSIGFATGTRVAQSANQKWHSAWAAEALGAQQLFCVWDSELVFDGTHTPTVDDANVLPERLCAVAEREPSRVTMHDARGLPLRALRCLFIPAQGNASAAPPRGGIALPPSMQGPYATQRALPLCPIWPAFAADSMFYAALLLVSVRGSRAARQFLRSRSGRCIACGYDRRGEPLRACPECGHHGRDIANVPWMNR